MVLQATGLACWAACVAMWNYGDGQRLDIAQEVGAREDLSEAMIASGFCFADAVLPCGDLLAGFRRGFSRMVLGGDSGLIGGFGI
jgi:hypothetical protein